jgi:hypothetical protein
MYQKSTGTAADYRLICCCTGTCTRYPKIRFCIKLVPGTTHNNQPCAVPDMDYRYFGQGKKWLHYLYKKQAARQTTTFNQQKGQRIQTKPGARFPCTVVLHKRVLRPRKTACTHTHRHTEVVLLLRLLRSPSAVLA